ncbi:uncharacterized protein [Panulirus ornatus]|uniref:uncharacterized protein isoform X1 n=1 Tax=Panulirus ornatus TaxID=150431 RepID=UPI003A893520
MQLKSVSALGDMLLWPQYSTKPLVFGLWQSVRMDMCSHMAEPASPAPNHHAVAKLNDGFRQFIGWIFDFLYCIPHGNGITAPCFSKIAPGKLTKKYHIHIIFRGNVMHRNYSSLSTHIQALQNFPWFTPGASHALVHSIDSMSTPVYHIVPILLFVAHILPSCMMRPQLLKIFFTPFFHLQFGFSLCVPSTSDTFSSIFPCSFCVQTISMHPLLSQPHSITTSLTPFITYSIKQPHTTYCPQFISNTSTLLHITLSLAHASQPYCWNYYSFKHTHFFFLRKCSRLPHVQHSQNLSPPPLPCDLFCRVTLVYTAFPLMQILYSKFLYEAS